MPRDFHYATLTEAIDELRKKGFTIDFNLAENCIVCHAEKYDPADFAIVDVYRYEGDTDPADETAVYALASKDGKRGIMVTGYGAGVDAMSAETLNKIGKKK